MFFWGYNDPNPIWRKRIDQVSCGDSIISISGVDKVLAVSIRGTDETYKIELSNGKVIECTGNHRFLTENGWREAQALENGQGLFSPENVSTLWELIPALDQKRKRKIISVQSETLWSKQNYCSVSCAKRSKPTSLNAQARKKISQTLKEIRQMPIKRGGNGQLLPLPQLALLHALGVGWQAEFAIKTGAGHRNGIYPNCYKVDIANPLLMIAIELDGGSHSSLERQEQDVKKQEYLVQLGWSVFRVSNEKALHLYTTFTSQDILLTSLMDSRS